MRAALEGLRSDFSFLVEVVDVDSDPVLEAKYGELVPVLEAGNRELCHYFFDEARVREYLVSGGVT
jgi:thioredoxin reductase (NADPH)